MISLNKMKQYSYLEIDIIKDGVFNQLGMATSKYENKGVLSFLTDERFLNDILSNKSIVAIITTHDIYNKSETLLQNYGIALSNNPKKTFYQIHNHLTDVDFYNEKKNNQIDPSAFISKSAIIAGYNIKIGKNVFIDENVVINDGVEIGENSIIRSGTILGSQGFQFLNEGNIVMSVKSSGKVKINNNVEIQHNCCVDKGVLGGTTVIHEYVKIDNFVHIAHDCQIGDRTFITAGVKFGGRTIVGKDCWLGINSTISNGLVIGDNVTISLGSVVTKNVDSNKTVTGNFAIDHERFIQFIKTIR